MYVVPGLISPAVGADPAIFKVDSSGSGAALGGPEVAVYRLGMRSRSRFKFREPKTYKLRLSLIFSRIILKNHLQIERDQL